MSRALGCVVLLFGLGVCGFTMERTNTGLVKLAPDLNGAPPAPPTEAQASNNSPDINKKIQGDPEMQIPPGRLNELIYKSLGPPQIAPQWHSPVTKAQTASTADPYTVNEEDLDALFDDETDGESVVTPLEIDQENLENRPSETIDSSIDTIALKALWPNESSTPPNETNRKNETDGSNATVITEAEKYDQEIKKIFGTPTEFDTTENPPTNNDAVSNITEDYRLLPATLIRTLWSRGVDNELTTSSMVPSGQEDITEDYHTTVPPPIQVSTTSKEDLKPKLEPINNPSVKDVKPKPEPNNTSETDDSEYGTRNNAPYKHVISSYLVVLVVALCLFTNQY